MDFLPTNLFVFMMVVTRITAFFLILPIFGAQVISVRIRIALTLLLAVFFSVYMPTNISISNVSTLRAVIMLACEGCYGLMFGLIVVLIFNVVKITGRMAGREMGFSLSEVFDPMTGESGQPIAMLLEMFFLLFFISANGHHFFLRLIHKSFAVFPLGSSCDIASMTQGIVEASSVMLISGLQLAAPIMGAFMLLMITLAILARIAPEMNILFISLPMKIAMGLVMLIVFLPFINDFVSVFSDLMARLLPI